MTMLEEQAQLETVRPGRSLFVRKVRVGNVTQTLGTNTNTNSTNTNTNMTNAAVAATPPDADVPITTLQIVCVHGTCASEQQYHVMLEALHQIIIGDTGGLTSTSDYDTNNNSSSDHKVSIQCLLPDLVGCGQSPPATDSSLNKNKDMDSAYSNEEIMADLTALMETHVDPNLPVVLMGHSYACNVILPMLLSAKEKAKKKYPNLTACIFLSSAVRCPENPNPDGGHWMLRSSYVPDLLLNYLQPTMTNAFVEMAVHPDHTELRERVKTASNGNSMRTARAYHRNHKWYELDLVPGRADDDDAASAAATATTDFLDVPILVVHGAEDAIIPVAAGRSLATALSSPLSSEQQSESKAGHSNSEQQSSAAVAAATGRVEFVTVERARHLVMMEQPDEVARAVWKFLRPLCVFKE
jgi:pimeloyl-ACP methyl ester carboxylesterase